MQIPEHLPCKKAVGEPLLALELLAAALAASLGAECTAGLALLEPVTAQIDPFGPKVLILRTSLAVCVRNRTVKFAGQTQL